MTRTSWLALFALLSLAALPASRAGAAATPQVLVKFDGSVAGTTYTLGAGELDASGTFEAGGSVTVAGGVADIPGDVDGASGFRFHGPSLGLGALNTRNWISEAIFSPDVAAEFQPTIAASGRGAEPGNHILDVQGDTFLRYDGFGRTPKAFSTGYYDGGNEIVNVAPEPPLGQYSHVALVWDSAGSKLEGFVNGVSVGVADQNAYDISSPWISYGYFGRFANRAIDGKLSAAAFSTYTGAFNPATDFQLAIPEPGSMALMMFALALVPRVVRKK